MKAIFMRCCICLLACMFALAFSASSAKALLTVPVKDEPWNEVWIYAEDEKITPNVVIIYLHGDGNNGTRNIKDLDVMAKVNHPLKYAANGALPLPDDTLIICPQSRGNAQFRNQQQDLKDLIKEIHKQFPDALFILAGHSNGAIAAYKIALSKNEDIDAYVFISGNKPAESQKLPFVGNCFVAYGSENDSYHRRSDFSNLFGISLENSKYTKCCEIVDRSTKNRYMVGKWSHGQAPLVFLENFFWEWVDELSAEHFSAEK